MKTVKIDPTRPMLTHADLMRARRELEKSGHWPELGNSLINFFPEGQLTFFQQFYFDSMFELYTDIVTRAVNSFEHGHPIQEEARLQEIVKALDGYIFGEKDFELV